jgi:hypothetical protein
MRLNTITLSELDIQKVLTNQGDIDTPRSDVSSNSILRPKLNGVVITLQSGGTVISHGDAINMFKE